MSERGGTRLSSTASFTGRIFTVTVDRVTLPNGRTVSLDMVRHPGSVVLIPMHDDRQVVLIRQYRYMDSLFSFAARGLRSSHSTEEKLQILRSLGHACLAEHAQWALAHRDMRIDGLRW